jgi:hypothetical protein
VLQDKKKLMRYQIIATDTMMFTRYANTPHNGGEPDSDMKINHVMISYLILLFFVSMSIRSFFKRESDGPNNTTLFYYIWQENPLLDVIPFGYDA